MTLDEIRVEIDRIDNAIKPLFLERMGYSKRVAEAKEAAKGDVYVPEREAEVIAKRADGTEGEVREAYTAFLSDMMRISRRYQYGVLEEMQEAVLKECLDRAGLTGKEVHNKVTIGFSCGKEQHELGLYLQMVSLNKVPVNKIHAEEIDGTLHCELTLEGNVNDKNMKQLICHLGKESSQFAIVSVN